MSASRHVKAYVVPYYKDVDSRFYALGGISDKYATPTIELFGGGCAFGETPVENAQRELFEETSGTFRVRLRDARSFDFRLSDKCHATVFYFEYPRREMEQLCTNFPHARRYYMTRGIDHYTEMRQLCIFPMYGVVAVDGGQVIDTQSAEILKILRTLL